MLIMLAKSGLVTGLAFAGPDAGSPGAESRPAATRPMNMLLSAPAASRPAATQVAFAGATATILLTGQPHGTPHWRLAYRQTVVAQGRVQLDQDGRGRLSLVLPEVKHRSACTLHVQEGELVSDQDLVLYPRQRLADVAGRITELDLGVIDESGLVQKGLAAEGVRFKSLSTDLARDVFAGGTVIISGFNDVARLAAVCQRMDGRVSKGMTAILLNPPAGWQGWNVACIETAKPLLLAVHLAEKFAWPELPDDIGCQAWRAQLKTKPPETSLIWVAAPSAGSSQPSSVRQNLALCRSVGKGRVMVAVLPQLEDPAGDVVGRAALDELLVWSMKDNPTSTRPVRKNHD